MTRGETSAATTAPVIRQCWVYARFHVEETEYRAPGNKTYQPGCPYFVIDAAMTGCGYEPDGKDWKLWNVVKAWMHGPDSVMRGSRR